MHLRGRLLSLAVRRPVLTVFLLALAARVVVATYVAVAHDGFLFGDDQQYVTIAAAKATGQTQTWDDYTRFVYSSNLTLTLPMTTLFRLFGVHAVLGQLQVALFGALAAALVARLVLELGPRHSRAALAAGTAVAVLPSQVLFSSLTLKDALVWAALAALAVAAAVLGRTETRRRFVLLSAVTLVLLLLLAGLRQHTLVVAGWSLFLTSWFGVRRLRLERLAVTAAFAVVVPFAVGAGVAGAGLLTQVNALETQRALGAQGAQTAVVAPAPSTTAAVDPAEVVAVKQSAAAAAQRYGPSRRRSRPCRSRSRAPAHPVRRGRRRLRLGGAHPSRGPAGTGPGGRAGVAPARRAGQGARARSGAGRSRPPAAGAEGRTGRPVRRRRDAGG